jgi:hypothetical protein
MRARPMAVSVSKILVFMVQASVDKGKSAVFFKAVKESVSH